MLELTPDILLRAYAIGVFPMSEDRDDPELFWVDPRTRGIIPLDDVHVSRRLAKTIRADRFTVTYDTAFEATMEGCAESADDRPKTWINDRIITLYTSLHRMGRAHSVECRVNGELVGGLYGVSMGGAFFGESMFSRVRDASKVALIHLIARLRGGGYTLLDTQFITDHLKQFGAIEITRSDYRRRLENALKLDAHFHHDRASDDMEALLKYKRVEREERQSIPALYK
ncbi:MAG: leucyl/phenylalanyl-tRNA--protein transferase [Rhodospirillaceae bacterium]|nr:leucyl/phenylalanyl-tRNA--protein transferase [Rhodospirillaceae bacterium]MBT5665552.1 leucyl/phenylalanyl-tRNA--protein transferase [Rhodospirillaceae bacterium]MBT5811679.1 leucyl/phenylalanyl-tRNA--protein transferase [Rhodospirillaceae bacterium]